MKILVLIALILIFSSTECNHAFEDMYFVHEAINLPEGYKPIKVKTPYKPGPEWKIKNRNLKLKYWRIL